MKQNRETVKDRNKKRMVNYLSLFGYEAFSIGDRRLGLIEDTRTALPKGQIGT